MVSGCALDIDVSGLYFGENWSVQAVLRRSFHWPSPNLMDTQQCLISPCVKKRRKKNMEIWESSPVLSSHNPYTTQDWES